MESLNKWMNELSTLTDAKGKKPRAHTTYILLSPIESAREWTNNRVVLLLSFAEVYASALLRVHAYTQSELPE